MVLSARQRPDPSATVDLRRPPDAAVGAKGGAMGAMGDVPILGLTLLDVQTLPLLQGNASWYRRAGLSDAEIATAAEFRHPVARACQLGARLLARSSLAARIGCQPQDLAFARGPFGKPEVRGPAGAVGWHFNLSHGGHLVACATAPHAVGIDVESVAREIDPLPIARSHFSAAEAAWLAACPSRSRRRFLALWTLKEAYLKGRGTGLSAPLSNFRLRPTGARGFDVHADSDPSARWHARLHRVRGHWLSLATPVPARRTSMAWWEAP